MLCSLLGKNCHQQCHSAVYASSYNNDLSSKLSSLVQWWHDCYRVTNCFPLGAEVFSTKRNSHLELQPGQKLMSAEDTGPSEGSTAVVRLDGHDVSVKLLSKYLGLCLYRDGVSLTPRSFFCKRAEVSAQPKWGHVTASGAQNIPGEEAERM